MDRTMRSLLFILLLTVPTLAGPRTAPPRTAPPRTAPPRTGAKATKSKKPVTLWGIRWQPTVEDAIVVASKNKKKPRAVLLMRVLGDLKGKT